MMVEVLLAGMLMAAGAFAVKAGMGLQYLLSRVRGGLRARAGVLAAFGLAYLALFAVCNGIAGLWKGIPPDGAARAILESGMLLHVMASAGLAVWGGHLLRRPDGEDAATRGWLLLVVPCPVCMIVLILSLVAARTFLPGGGWTIMLGVYAVFAAIAGLTAAAFRSGRLTGGASPSRTLGWAMLLTAVYFLTSILFLPPIQDAGEIYSVAERLTVAEETSPRLLSGAFAAALLSFGIGFFRARGRARRVDPWL